MPRFFRWCALSVMVLAMALYCFRKCSLCPPLAFFPGDFPIEAEIFYGFLADNMAQELVLAMFYPTVFTFTLLLYLLLHYFELDVFLLQSQEDVILKLDNSAQIFNTLSDIPGDVTDAEELLEVDTLFVCS